MPRKKDTLSSVPTPELLEKSKPRRRAKAKEVEGPEPEKQYTKVAVCGTAPSSRMEANEQDDDTEIWALNDCWTFLKRANRWFEIHERVVWEADGEEHVKFLMNFPNTIYMLKEWEDVPGSMRYPYEGIRDRFFPEVDLKDPDALKQLMLGSSIDYMLALALYEGFEEIRVLGINMASQTEYVHQLPSCDFWLGQLKGEGRYCRICGKHKRVHENQELDHEFIPVIKLYLPDSCPMLEVPLYGTSRRTAIDKDILQTRLSRVLHQQRRLEKEMDAVHGAVQAIEQLASLLNEPLMIHEAESDKKYIPPKIDISHAIGDVEMAKLNQGGKE